MKTDYPDQASRGMGKPKKPHMPKMPSMGKGKMTMRGAHPAKKPHAGKKGI